MAVRKSGHAVFALPATAASLMLMQLHVNEHGIQSEIIHEATHAGDDKGDPEFLIRCEEARDRGPRHGSQRAHHARDAHDGGALLRLDDGGDKRRPRRLIHIVEPRAHQQQSRREPQRRRQREQQHGRRRRHVREDHGVDEADFTCERPRECRPNRAEEVAHRRDVAQRRLRRVELRVHVVVRQRVRHHPVRERVDHQQEPQLVHDRARLGRDLCEVHGQPVFDATGQAEWCCVGLALHRHWVE